MNLIEALRRKVTTSATSYRALVRAVAQGANTPPPAEATELLKAAGKTVDDLERDADVVRKRIDIAARLVDVDAAEREIAALGKKIAAADERLAAARREYDNAVSGPNARIRSIRASLTDSDQAKRGLIETCPHEDVLAEIQAAMEAQTVIHNRVNHLRDVLQKHPSRIESERQRAHDMNQNQFMHPVQREEMIERYERELEEAKTELPKAESNLRAAEARTEAAYRAALEP